ncbi:hypothetical protein DMUE_3038 [Dictyocoela muelleri]|nr:hypothetical protein DMUE_3038 [Dictyocoela muelleri]
MNKYVSKSQTKNYTKYKTMKPIRTDNCLLVFRIFIEDSFELIYRFSVKQQERIISKDLAIFIKSFCIFMKFIRLLFHEYIIKIWFLGGENIICQIDEKYFFHKHKFNRRRAARQLI